MPIHIGLQSYSHNVNLKTRCCLIGLMTMIVDGFKEKLVNSSFVHHCHKRNEHTIKLCQTDYVNYNFGA